MANTKKIEEMLTTAIFEVFEKMFFVFTEPLRSDGGTYHMKASITFSGPANGELQILFSKGIAETMVENMLNLERDEITSQITADCMKESINIICGNFVRKLNPEKGFHLSIPTFEMISEDIRDQQQTAPYGIRLTFASETGNMEVYMAAEDIL
jgi:CheY-specific phosphatase CheX